MPITPSSINFQYELGGNIPPVRIVNYSHNGIGTVVTDKPSWITLTGLTATTAYIKLHSSASNLSVGTHTGQIDFSAVYQDDYYQPDGTLATFNVPLGVVNVTVVVTEVFLLSLTPDSVTFNYELGGATPADQTINVSSENSWTVTESTTWLSTSATSGSNNGSFQISVTPNGLSIGTHTAIVTVDDGIVQEVTVTLVVSEPATGSDYLYVNPLVLEFGYTQSGVLPPLKPVEINASENWTVTANQSWINLTATTGSAGVSVLEIGIHNAIGLSIGDHSAIVTIQAGSIVKIISVTLSVYAFAEILLDSNELYFTEENNMIVVSSGRIDTHLSINATTIYEGEQFDVPYKNPFFQGQAKKRLGLEARKIIGDRPFSGVSNALVYIPYFPVDLNLQIREEELYQDVIAQEITLNNISFIKGKIPINNWMSDSPRKLFLTKNGLVYFSFRSDGITPANLLTITGAIQATYTFNNEVSHFYSVIFSLAELDLNIGDQIRLQVLDFFIDVQIKPDGKDHCSIFWENQWGCWDAFEATGEVKIEDKFKSESFSFRKNHLEKETKVLQIESTEVLKINTGWVYSDPEVNTVRKLLKSRNVYIHYKNQFFKLRNTTKKLEVHKTDKFLKSYNLTFENVIIT
jgi:hypothetical protein